MPTWLLNKWTWIGAAFLLLAAWGGWQKVTSAELESKNVKLTVQVDGLKADVAAERTKVQLKDAAINALQASAEVERVRTEVVEKVVREIEQAPATDNGAVAPVLKRTLQNLDAITGAKK